MNLETAADRERALSVACPHCRAEQGQVCVRPDGEELQRAAAHTSRITAAGVVHAPIDSRDLRR